MGSTAGIIAAILIYAILTQAVDVKKIITALAPLATALVAQNFFRAQLAEASSDEIVVGAVSAFLVILLYPVGIFMVRFGRDVGQAEPPPKIRKSRGPRK
jgi:chromate transport protein ChrA